ncbi:MAG TPA: DUF1697 domain-containing protein [Ignavibacteriaceae bacterium]|nr:DUF1697 domain-containing protein [Ignavibacteriaceae bacterium]
MKYIALLRGISPSNSNMRNEKLRDLFEELGFKKVQSIISSGNILFESPADAEALEIKIEKAFQERLGFKSSTIIRSDEEIKSLIKKDPFKGIKDTPRSRLNVTFLKNAPDKKHKFPFQPEKRTYKILKMLDQSVFSVIDLSGDKTPDLMSWLEKEFGKEITTRTWKTVQRILNKMESS